MLSLFVKSRVWQRLFVLPLVTSTKNQAVLARMRSQDPLVWIDCEVSLESEKPIMLVADERR